MVAISDHCSYAKVVVFEYIYEFMLIYAKILKSSDHLEVNIFKISQKQNIDFKIL